MRYKERPTTDLEIAMRHILAMVIASLCLSTWVLAADTKPAAPASDCAAKAAEKKLAGAAKNSFMKKCEKDAGAAAPASAPNADCVARATEKKLAGAARNSFMKKCEKDAAAAKK